MNQPAKNDWAGNLTERAIVLLTVCGEIMRELYDGIRTGILPWGTCLAYSLPIQVSLYLHWDRWVAARSKFRVLYPVHSGAYAIYYTLLVCLPFIVWSIHQRSLKQRLTRRLTEVFRSCGLQNNLGKPPHFVFDRPLDTTTRKLRLSRATLAMESFQKAKGALEGGLQVFIDEIRENRVEGTVDIVYAHEPMPSVFRVLDFEKLGHNQFIVGTTRSNELKADFPSVPHLLVAGQTGGGKSTFLRQLITSLYLNDQTIHFTLIDLKGGVEFQLFEDLPGVHVTQTVDQAIHAVGAVTEKLEDRMKLLKANRCVGIEEYSKLPVGERVGPGKSNEKSASLSLNRHVIVVDEAAEMFLAGSHASAKDVQAARRSLSQVARQGRSCGIHLIVATQRPDARALDPQIKSNLPGILCFQMANDISSITVLGNGRATDLPPIPGRAIWKKGSDMMEVQTPYLEPDAAERLLEKFYVRKQKARSVNESPAPQVVAQDLEIIR